MSNLNTEKLSVDFILGTTPIGPVIPRRYTITHSNLTEELYLTISSDYAYDKFTKMRDEVLGEWPLALDTIRYGDRKLFTLNHILDICPIIVSFNSADPYYNSIEHLGTFSDYAIE